MRDLYRFIRSIGHLYEAFMTRYHRLADIIGDRIEQGLYNRGQRLPSVRTERGTWRQH